MMIAHVVLLALSLVPVKSSALGILIPAYFDPGSGTNWAALNQAARRVPLTAIMNPASGPSTSPRAAYTQAINALRSAGGKVIGYVHSSYTQRPIVDVKADIDRYHSFYAIDGIFVDEVTNDQVESHLAYYEDLYRYIKATQPSYWAVANPGINAPGVYLTRPTADALVTFESNTGYTNYRSDAWTQTNSPAAFSHLCYAVAAAATMTNYVELAFARNAGYIYVTDDAGTNPWDRLPSYWEAEVSLIEEINRQAASNQPAVLKILQTNHTAQVTISGAPGRYLLQGSSNLTNWQSVATNVTATGKFIVSEQIPAQSANQIYRAEQ